MMKDYIEDKLFEFDKSLMPDEDIRGLKTSVSITFSKKKWEEPISFENKEKYLKVFSKVYLLEIDSTCVETNFVVTREQSIIYFEDFIDIQNLSRGRHTLRLKEKYSATSDSLVLINTIPFWYYPN